MNRPPEVLESSRLQLRRLRRSDAHVVFSRWAQDQEVARYLTWRPHDSVADSEAHVARCESAWDEGSEFVWMIEERQSSKPVGSIAAHVRGHRVSLGYLLASDSWGSGYMTEAVNLVSQTFLEMEGVWRIWAVCDIENQRSASVLERAGFTREGILSRWIIHPNISTEPRDVISYSRTAGHSAVAKEADSEGRPT